MSNPTTGEQDNKSLVTLDLWIERNFQWSQRLPKGVLEDLVFCLEASHNAALAAEREKVKDAQEEAFAAYAEVDAIREQLAAEREKYETMERTLNDSRDRLIEEVEELRPLREQLAAERKG